MNPKQIYSLLAVLLSAGISVAQQISELPPQVQDEPPVDVQISPVLYKLDRATSSRSAFDEIRDDYQIKEDAQGRVEVEVVGPIGKESVPDSIVTAHGGWIRLKWRHRASVRVLPSRLVELARALPVGYRLEVSGNGRALDVSGEGPAATGSDVYRDNGADGSGIKVAVLDNGYEGYLAAFFNGDVPLFADHEIYNGGDLDDGGPHGTACVEQIFDHAPGAEIFLVKLESNNPTQLGNAIDWCIDRDIDIITMSITYYNGGWADGTGDACAAIKNATDNGILVFMAAGNFGLQHWRGPFQDDDSDGWHNWSPSDETNHVDLQNNDWLNVYLQWDDPPGGAVYDYDIYLYDDTISTILEKSVDEVDSPFERFSYTNTTGSAQRVKVLIRLVSGSATDIQLFQRAKGSSNAIEHYVSAGSVTSTAASTEPNLIAVGAADKDRFYTPQASGATVVTSWSSRGPTNSGNIKPEVVGPTYISCFVYPYVNGNPSATFGGTSCATPNVAGTAAALWSSLPNYSASGIRLLLLRQASLIRDWGASGEDDDHGHGGASLYPYHHDTAWVDRKVFNPFGSTLIPFASVGHAYSHVPSGGRILFLGREYPETLTMDKDVLLDTVVEPAVIGE